MTEQTPVITDEEKAKRKAYSQATTRLRNDYRDEFNGLLAQEMKAAGYDWTPRPDAKEKARQQIRALLAEHPDLAEETEETEPS